MLLSLIYYIICRALSAGHGPMDDRDVELLVLRHQLRVLRRQVKRPCLRRSDRLILAAASPRLHRPRWSSFIVKPETLLRWHRELVRRKWAFRRRHRGGRPGFDALTTDLSRCRGSWNLASDGKESLVSAANCVLVPHRSHYRKQFELLFG